MKTGMDIAVGDEVMVVRAYGKLAPTRATVTKAARVWLTIETVGGRSTWKMRRDKQNEDSGYRTGGNRFYTLEQWEARERRAKAELVLRGANVSLGFGHDPRWSDEKVSLLAEAVTKILES